MPRDDSVSPRRDRKRRHNDDDQDEGRVYARDSRRHRSHDIDSDDERPRKRRSLSPARRERRDDRRSTHRQEISRSRSRSPNRSFRDKRHHQTRSRSRSKSPKALQRSRAPLPPQKAAFENDGNAESLVPAVEKQKPNFAPSGRLAAASNTVQTAGQTIVLKYHEPAEARKPSAKDAWRMYTFKDDEIMDTIPLHEQSCWLLGRELAVCDIPIEHPSASKQHAVIQFRYIEKRNEFGDKVGRVKPYLIDLESGNGTFVNDEEIAEGRYVEIKDGDVIKFGRSRREYVVQLPKS